MSQNVVSLREPTAVAPEAPPADPAELARGFELQAQQRPRLFRAVWRWHFYPTSSSSRTCRRCVARSVPADAPPPI
jgi:hypothetical protein